jgi:hypothetical protein
MACIVETYYLPNIEIKARPSPQAVNYDILQDFTEACRAELRGDITTSLKEATCILHETSHTYYVLHYDCPGDDTPVVRLAGSWKLEDGLPAMTEIQLRLGRLLPVQAH